MNLGFAIVLGAALIGLGFAISHRYEISAHAGCVNPTETACSAAWRVDQWTGAMTFCEYGNRALCTTVGQR